MDPRFLIILGIVAILGIGVLAYLLVGTRSGAGKGMGAAGGNMARMVAAQRYQGQDKKVGRKQASFFDAIDDTVREGGSKLTLEKKLRFATWSMPPMVFRAIWVLISFVIFYLFSLKCNTIVTLVSLSSGPLFMNWLLNKFINHRFKAFDGDYPAFLASVTSLLKTGMNTMTALESAAQGLDEGSLVREEVYLMLDRLRYGVPEDKSIGVFGEDINHPEIELFVQALLLSRQVGGNLADTLERLAKQVRKRQFFRKSAQAAVGMQRGSIIFILAIMVGLVIYMYFIYPDLIVGALEDPVGWQVYQYALLTISGGIFWMNQVTKIRV